MTLREELVKNPSLINTYSCDECSVALKDASIYRKQGDELQKVKVKLRAREKEVARLERERIAAENRETKRIQDELEKDRREHESAMKVYDRLITTFNCIEPVHQHLAEEQRAGQHKKMYGRIISCAIHSCCNVVLGLHSAE